MANNEESDPLIPRQNDKDTPNDDARPISTSKCGANPPKAEVVSTSKCSAAPSTKKGGAPPQEAVPIGLPVAVVDPTMLRQHRARWSSGIFSCLGKNDEFYSSDVEVCLLGSFAPCVLYGTNAERLDSSTPGTFAHHCLPYTGLYVMGNSLFGWNCIAPWFSYPVRTSIRRKFNLEGSCQALVRSHGCRGSCAEDEIQLESCEASCDFVTHVFCHACALCQEGRELRRRLAHPGFSAQPVLAMVPPNGQIMGR